MTDLPAPGSLETLETADLTMPIVNSYQPPIGWERAEGYQVYDGYGNRWIDFTSTAVAANSGHGHPAVRAALAKHVEAGVLAQFSFVSSIRVELAQRLLELAPPGIGKSLLLDRWVGGDRGCATFGADLGNASEPR